MLEKVTKTLDQVIKANECHGELSLNCKECPYQGCGCLRLHSDSIHYLNELKRMKNEEGRRKKNEDAG